MSQVSAHTFKFLIDRIFPAKLVMFIYFGFSLLGVFAPTSIPDWLRDFYFSFLVALAISQVTQLAALLMFSFGYAQQRNLPTPKQREITDNIHSHHAVDHFAFLGMIAVVGYSIWLAMMGRDLYSISGSLMAVGFFIELKMRTGALKEDRFIFKELLYSGLAAFICSFIAFLVLSNSPKDVRFETWPYTGAALYFAFRIMWIQFWQEKSKAHSV